MAYVKTNWTETTPIDPTNLNKIEGGIETAESSVVTHEAKTNNPHVTTKTHVGLGSVLNYGLATTLEAQTGASNLKYMTPIRTKEAILALAPAPSAVDVPITDAGTYFTTDNVEQALQDLGYTLNASRGNLITSVNNILGS